jgi:hypothetical protein
MAHVGHSVARFNIFLDIPTLLRSLSQSLHGKEGPEMKITLKLLDEIKLYDPLDPTHVYEQYFGNWWNYEKKKGIATGRH